jgi:hypothetical protein
MEEQNFSRTIEDFICERCSTFNVGNGYTNHCSNCLWSKHVDIIPGDRASDCLGLMQPVDFELKKGVLHRCTICKFERYNKIQMMDDYDMIVALSSIRNLP